MLFEPTDSISGEGYLIVYDEVLVARSFVLFFSRWKELDATVARSAASARCTTTLARLSTP